MTHWIDISVMLRADLPRWPGSIGFTRQEQRTRDGVINSTLVMDPHVGTHVDAPSHHLEGGRDVAALDISSFLGQALVIDCGDVEVLDATFLSGCLRGVRPERLLFRTRNGAFYPDAPDFRDDFTALDESGAEWLADAGVSLVGIDYLSVQRHDAGAEVHRALLAAGVTILECLDLRGVVGGWYELLALPVLVASAEAAPVRALVRPISDPT